MKKYKICVTGNCNDEITYDGQTIRTRRVLAELEKVYGKDRIKFINYRYLKSSKPKLLFELVKGFAGCENFLVISIGDSIRTLAPVCFKINKLFRRKVYYELIGGSLPNKIKDSKNLETAKRYEGIFVETSAIYDALKNAGLTRVYRFPNFKYPPVLSGKTPSDKPPYRLVYMSRVCEEKGTAEMIEVVKKVNADKVRFTLDIYGGIELAFKETFAKIQKDLPEYIAYKGVAEFEKTSEILQEYFLQLFPTKVPTEGHPASILDSYFAGVPVLCSRWNSFADIVDENSTGLAFDFGDYSDMERKLREIYDRPETVISMRKNCVEKTKQFAPETVIKIMTEVIGK